MASKTPGEKITLILLLWIIGDPYFLIMNHLLYLLILFLNFLSSCHRILVVVVIDKAYENALRG